MKIQIFCILVILLILSCGPEPDDYIIEYTFKNVSNQKVNLKVDDAYIGKVHKDMRFLLLPNSEITYSYEDQNYTDGPFGAAADTVYVIFNDTKQLIYWQNDGKPRSVFNISNFEKDYIGNNGNKYKYYITDEDYNNAVKIK